MHDIGILEVEGLPPGTYIAKALLADLIEYESIERFGRIKNFIYFWRH